MKYMVVTGGVISGVGKGVISSSIGLVLKANGFRVTAIKIDPYINIDAGTFSPYEHGEVFVLDDGGEVDLDFGNYERFLGIRPRKENNLTTGKVFLSVINNERKGDYLGKTVQVVPHVTNRVQDLIEQVSKIPVDGTGETPEICIVELGGTVGDAEGFHFMEAIRQFQRRVGKDNLIVIHVAFVLELLNSLEQKTKPLQDSVKKLRSFGVTLDILICRSEKQLQESIITRICHAAGLTEDQILSIPNLSNIYRVPLLLESQGFLEVILSKLQLKRKLPEDPLFEWRSLVCRMDSVSGEVKIGLIGKYTKNRETYTSVIRSLEDAGTHAGVRVAIQLVSAEALERDDVVGDQAWEALRQVKGIVIPGGFGGRGTEGLIQACRFARENQIPFLGICLGFQCSIIEICRSLIGLLKANSDEFVADLPEEDAVIIEMPEHSGTLNGMGGTMRLGLRRTRILMGQSTIKTLYGNVPFIEERHRHRYEVNPRLIPALRFCNLNIIGIGMDEGVSLRLEARIRRSSSLPSLSDYSSCSSHSGSGNVSPPAEPQIRLEIVELKDHPYFVGVQFHPEYRSSPLRPSPPFLGLILAATNQLETHRCLEKEDCIMT